MSGQIYPDFNSRLLELCKRMGICDKIKGLAPALARELLNAGIVQCLSDDRDTELKNTRRAIARDLENNDPARIPGERLIWYSSYFHCSADFLLGFIDTPTHEQMELQELTDLSDEAARCLLGKERLVINALTDLLAGLSDSDTNDPGNIATVRRALLYDLHAYLTDPGRITGMFSGFDNSMEIDGDIFASGTGSTLTGFSSDRLPAILMLSIQEHLQEIRNDIQKRQ